jgi:hypothetical protein
LCTGFWHILDKLEEQIKIPARLTYRAVGSGAGISEFLGKDIPKDSGINDFKGELTRISLLLKYMYYICKSQLL